MSANNKRNAIEAGFNDEEDDYTSLTVADLKAELENRGLSKSGKKVVLVERLRNDDGNGDNERLPTLIAQAPLAKSPAKSTDKVEKTGYTAKSMAQLKEECQSRDISTGGRKNDLVERLEDDDIEKAIINDPTYVPRRDEVAITTGEKRLHPFEPRADADFRERYRKARKERMIMLSRKKGRDINGVVNETFDIAGSSGSVYTTTIGCMYKCNCMDFNIRKVRCKHVVYALVIILKVPVAIASQKALLSTEVEEIFENAPITEDLSFDAEHGAHPGIRKPIEGDCPICSFMFEEGDDLVWCMAACGQNVHQQCFAQWKSHGGISCVYCRSSWIEGSGNDSGRISGAESIKARAPKIGSYKNIAHLDIYKNAPMGSQR